MSYFIFLKSLRSLGEFRKNPHVKIPPKSPCTNFQSLCIFKNPKFYSKIILLSFRPIRPFSPAAAHSFFSNRPIFPPLPTGPRPPSRPSQPSWPNRPPVIFFLPHRSQARRRRGPASRRLHGCPDSSTASNSPSFPPSINRRHSPPLQSQKSEPSTPPMKLLQAGN